MKNQWFTFMTGRVLVKISGNGIERFINKLARLGLNIWKVKRNKNGDAYFYIAFPDVKKLRHAVRNTGCSIYFIRGEGMPFLWKRIIKHSGFPLGVLCFFVIILFLSNVTWGIHIEGADPETEHKIRLELKELGINVGAIHLFADKPDVIQRKLTDQIDNITWIGVELKGTTYHFQVVQKTEPEKIELESPRHLVANKKAIIVDMFIEKGKSMVKINQYVDKGQLLVSGAIGHEDKPIHVIAKGEVWGQTWYNTTVEIPLDSEREVLTGEEMRKYYIQIGKYKIPIWGFAKNKIKNYEIENDDKDIFFLGKKLPVQFSKEVIRGKEKVKSSLTEEEAIEVAKEYARNDLLMNIPPDAKIDKEIILQEKVENGKVMLSINFQVIENIAIEKPIIQGD